MTESVKVQLTLPALERLIDGDPGIELSLRKQVCREIVKKHFKTLADEELWRLSHGMTEAIATEVEKVVNGFVDGKRDPTGRWKWFNSYPTTETVNHMIREACKKYFNDTITEQAKKAVEEWVIGGESIEKMVERKINAAIRTQVMERVNKGVEEAVAKAVEKATAEFEVKLKLVEE